MLIIINAREVYVDKKELSFDELVDLAFEDPARGPMVIFTISYRTKNGNHEGILSPGSSVKVKKGMIFNVTRTDKS